MEVMPYKYVSRNYLVEYCSRESFLQKNARNFFIGIIINIQLNKEKIEIKNKCAIMNVQK